jgi:ketosteroid isomerase-like protein
MADNSALKSEVESRNALFMAAYNSGDAAAIAALYAPDATLMPPGAPMMNGTLAIGAFWRGAISAGIRNIRLTTISVDGDADSPAETGRATLEVPSDNGHVEVSGKYLVVWRRVNGVLHLQRDIWNLDA